MAFVKSTEVKPQFVLPDDAIEVARAAAVEEAGSAVGELVGSAPDDDGAITVSFAAGLPGYTGWHWSVTLAAVPGDPVTVSEVALLPGDGALLAPAWVPWDERVRAGDLGVGDLLPTTEDDDRLVPGYLESDDPAVQATALELGLGRVRVLSRDGRIDIADRWHDGTFGPADQMAVAAPGRCGTCGFFLPLAGSLGGMFGACGNELAPADGRVVDVEYGCGAHSEAAASALRSLPVSDVVIDELVMDVHHRLATPIEDGAGVEVGLDGAEPAEDAPTSAWTPPEMLPTILVLEQGPQPIAALEAAPQLSQLEAGTAVFEPDAGQA
ncbi:MAG: DUF3027 domain-containing protein [Nakamurella sp.]